MSADEALKRMIGEWQELAEEMLDTFSKRHPDRSAFDRRIDELVRRATDIEVKDE